MDTSVQNAITELNPETQALLASLPAASMQAWLDVHAIKNEKGDPITFLKHSYQRAIYLDQSQYLVVMKCAQVGLSTLEINKTIHDAEINKMDIIYTLPTDGEAAKFVSGKVNRIIQNNPHLLELTADKDSIQQKQIGQSMVYFLGTFNAKAAIMVTADRVVHDEIDSSNQLVIPDFQSRLQHSKFKQTHVFSHPSVPDNGVHVYWKLSNQREWFVRCPHCQRAQILTWSTEDPKKMSIDVDLREFVCKACHGILDWHVRDEGWWRQRNGTEAAKWSGYHVSLMMNPDTTAGEIIDKHQDVLDGRQTMDYFYNKVLGLPYSGGGNSVTEEQITALVTDDPNQYVGRLVIGVDPGIKIRFVVGNVQGLVSYGEVTDYMPDEANNLQLSETLEYYLVKFPTSVMVIDEGGDIIGSRKLQSKYPGRVFLCHYGADRHTKQLFRWGEKEEWGHVNVDRNRAIQLVVDEIREQRFHLYNGTAGDWHNYYLHWSHIYRTIEENALGVAQYKWLRNDRDDWVHATVYWRVGISRFGQTGSIVGLELKPDANSLMMNPDGTATFNPDQLFGRKGAGGGEPWWVSEDEGDWRDA